MNSEVGLTYEDVLDWKQDGRLKKGAKRHVGLGQADPLGQLERAAEITEIQKAAHPLVHLGQREGGLGEFDAVGRAIRGRPFADHVVQPAVFHDETRRRRFPGTPAVGQIG